MRIIKRWNAMESEEKCSLFVLSLKKRITIMTPVELVENISRPRKFQQDLVQCIF
jgi:hypothetical protein